MKNSLATCVGFSLSFGYLLIWLVGISNLSLIMRSVRNRPIIHYSWITAASLVLIGMGITAHMADRDTAGYAGALLWVLLIALPNLGASKIDRLCNQHRFSSARQWAFLCRMLHPSREYRSLPTVIEGIEGAYEGKAVSTTEIIRRLGDIGDSLSSRLLSHWFSLTADWSGLVEWVRKSEITSPAGGTRGRELVEKDSSLMTCYLRALGETGDLEQLVRLCSRYAVGSGDLSGYTTAVRRLFLFAFCGKRTAVTRLFNGPLRKFPSSNQLFWLATADMAAGNPAAGETFRLLMASDDLRVRKGAERRILSPVAKADEMLTMGSANEVIHQEIEAGLDEQLIAAPAKRSERAYVTYVLIAANVIMFAIEGQMGGSEDVVALFRLGALVPELVRAGEWWRIPASMFLHFGPLHLGMNMLALFLVGPFVEFAVGGPRYLIVYLGSGVLSMGSVCVLALEGALKGQFLVGASGAIMGLIGASAAIFFRIWKAERTKFASQRLSSLGIALLIQLAFDLSTPEVSMSSHLAGVIAGAAIGLMMKHRVRNPPRR